VLAEDDRGLGEPVEEAVVDHRLCALGRLFGGLEHDKKGPVPCVGRFGEEGGGA
jgi:hypothetical protein